MVKINMNQQRKLSRHNSRQSSIGETASVCSTKSAKSTCSADTNGTQQSGANSTNSKKPSNGLSSKHGSQDSQLAANAYNGSGAGQGAQAANILNVAEMLLHGVADNEILDIWLKSIQCEEFVSKFIDAGYDMPTLSRITPQDLTAIGVTDPTKRLKILTEIKKLNLQDGLPNFLPASLSHWLSLIRLDSYYYKSLRDQQIDTMEKMCQLTWEDFEELGITKLGHQKRFQLAIERVKELELAGSKTSASKTLSEPIYDTNPSQILLVASTENHSMNGPIINKQSSTSEISSTGSGSMHSVYSAASVQYQPTYAPFPENSQQNQGQQQQSTIVSQQLSPSGTQIHQAHNQQQQAIYGQLPPPLIYQQPASQIMQQPPPPPPQQQQQSHYQQRQQMQQQHSLHLQSNQTQYGLNNDVGNGMIVGQQPQQNRQSINQLPFAALAKLPKHQQLLLQQSSIYATLSRQSFKAKQPPPPVPIRTNSLKSNSLVDDASDKHPRQNQQQHNQPSYQQSQLNNCHHTTSTSSLYRSDTISSAHGPGQVSRGQFNSQTMLTKNKSFSGNAHMEASRQRFLNRNSQQPQPTVHQQFPHQLSQQFLSLNNQNINNNNSCNQNLIYGIHGSSNGIVDGTRTLNGNPIENDSNFFRPPPNNYIGSNDINRDTNNHQHHHQTQQQNAPQRPAINSNNDNIHRDSASLYHSDDFDLQSDTNSTKSLIVQSSSSLVVSPVNQHSVGGCSGNQQTLCSLSQGSGSSQTLYNSASSGGSNDQSLNSYSMPQSGDMMQRSATTAASSCTLNDANLSMSDARQQQRQAPNGSAIGSGSITANSSAANLPFLANSTATRLTNAASANVYTANNTKASHCNATTGRDDDFPPPPSPLKLTDLDEHDLVSLSSDSNFNDISHGLMTFRVGI